MGKKINGAVGVVSAAAITLTSIGLQLAVAAPVPTMQPPAAKQVQPAHEVTDFSSRARRYYRRGGNPAALGAVVGIFGSIAAIAAANSNRGYYYGYPGYYGDYGYPGYYGGYGYPQGYYPYAYGPRYYYAPGYYRPW
jgi:hypothetical protein